jgi:hypothetical protein
MSRMLINLAFPRRGLVLHEDYTVSVLQSERVDLVFDVDSAGADNMLKTHKARASLMVLRQRHQVDEREREPKMAMRRNSKRRC